MDDLAHRDREVKLVCLDQLVLQVNQDHLGQQDQEVREVEKDLVEALEKVDLQDLQVNVVNLDQQGHLVSGDRLGLQVALGSQVRLDPEDLLAHLDHQAQVDHKVTEERLDH